MKFIIYTLFIIILSHKINYSMEQQDTIELSKNSSKKYLQQEDNSFVDQDPLDQLMNIHRIIEGANTESKTLFDMIKSKNNILPQFRKIKEKIHLLDDVIGQIGTVFLPKSLMEMVSNDIRYSCEIIKNISLADTLNIQTREIIEIDDVCLKTQFYLGSLRDGKIDKSALENQEELLKGIKSLFFYFKKKQKAPNFFEKLFGYNPEMEILRATLQNVHSKKVPQSIMAKLFNVPQPTVSKFLNGSDSKTLLNNFKETISKNNSTVSSTDDDNTTTERSHLLSLKEKKNQ